MPKFNASQQEAIAARNRSILVSAAAGSGKTTVMVEKIRQTLIDHPEASISQFLVITFTRDAAQNMKDKLRSLLEEAAQEGIAAAARALGEIETASISTIRRDIDAGAWQLVTWNSADHLRDLPMHDTLVY